MPDGESLITFLDMWESPDFPASDVIFTETALEYFYSQATTRQASKLRVILLESKYRCVVFRNEHFTATHVSTSKKNPKSEVDEVTGHAAMLCTANWCVRSTI